MLMETTVDGDEICASLLEFVIEFEFEVDTVTVVHSVLLPFNAFMALMYFLWKCVCGVGAIDDRCVLDCCVEMALITLVKPLLDDTITALEFPNGDVVFGMTFDFCDALETVFTSMTALPPGLK